MQNRLQSTSFPNNSYLSGNMAKLISMSRPFFEGKLELNSSNNKIFIKPVNNGCGINSKVLNTIIINRKPVFTEESDWTIDITNKSINRAKYLGGISDGKPITANMFYHLYYFLTDNLQPYGYGLICQPKTQASALSGSAAAKGSEYEFTVQHLTGWAFGIGGRVSVYVSDDEWNTGTVRSVSNNAVTIAMDNNTSYGTSIEIDSAPWITQYGTDYLYPVDSIKSKNNNKQTLVSNYYLLISWDKIYINESVGSPPEKFIQFAYNPNTGFGIPAWWDKNITSTPQILHPDYMMMDGSKVINPLSPLVGQAITDLTTNKRFIRADTDSGTEQDDAFQGHYHNVGRQANPAAKYAISNTTVGSTAKASYVSSNADDTFRFVATIIETNGTHGTPRTDSETRPVNISMIPVIKIVE